MPHHRDIKHNNSIEHKLPNVRDLFPGQFSPNIFDQSSYNSMPKFSCGMHVWQESCMMIGQLGWEKTDLI